MTFSPQHLEEHSYTPGSDVSVIRREFVELTGNLFSAVILNQLLYWTLRVKDFDYLLEEERRFQPSCNVSPRHGWIYKTAPELNEETMLGLSPPSIRKYLKLLIDEGWIDEREHPTEKWNKTTQYRVNIRRLQEDLDHQGHSLPEVYFKAFRGTFQRKPLSQQNSCEKLEKTLDEKNFSSNQRIFASKEKFFASNTENTTENTNKEKLATHARENFSDLENSISENLDESVAGESDLDESVLENSEKPVLEKIAQDKPVSSESIAAEMLKLWGQHVAQHLPPDAAEAEKKQVLRLTDERKDQLESLFAFHFQNDMRLWERFCLRVKSSSFLMGGGPRKWCVRLDWLLREGNLSKALDGKYDDSHRSGQSESSDWKLEKVQDNPALTAEKAAIVNSIKDPTWRKWCSRLAQGVRLNEFRMAPEPLSVSQLSQIANAWFLEVEDDRLVWVGSSDISVLNKIEDLRLKISWVFKKEYPKASTLRTRLASFPHHQDSAQSQGESHE